MNNIIPFNPFNKSLKEIIPSDLVVLRDVVEGWYIEYKSQIVPTSSIAKSLAAFANHYGGWLFYGIKEAQDGSNKAGDFLGLDPNEVVLLVERIRNAAKDCINPAPYYEFEILEGPCDEIGLSNNKSIVVVLIPNGPNAPYINSDGRIYRRVADASDPKPETDRFILDQLWQRGQKSQATLASFLQTEATLSEGEGEVSYMDLFLLPDPLGATGQRSDLTFNQFVEFLSDTKAPVNHVYDNFFPMADGFIGRDVNTNDPYNLVSTWKHYKNGFSVISMPFPSALIGEITDGGWLHGYEQEASFIQLAHKKKHSASQLLDINQVLFFVMSAINQQRYLMEHGKIKGPLYAKAVLRNIWRRVPFLDTENYIQLIAKHGFPIIQFDKEFAPYGTTFDSLVLIPENNAEDENDPIDSQATSAVYILVPILNALGISVRAVLSESEEELTIAEWWRATLRVSNVNKHRAGLFANEDC